MNDYTAINSFDQGETFKNKTEEWFEQSGILGQKWGIRRYQNPDGSLTPAGRARYGRAERKAEKQAAKQAKRDALKEEITKRRGISRSDIKNMSDQDLNSAINRKQRENQYYDLMHPEEAKAREFTNKALNTLMSSALEVGSKVGKEYAEKALKKSLGLTDDEAEKLQKEMNKVKLEQNKLNLQVTKNNIKKTELDNKQKEKDLKKAKQQEDEEKKQNRKEKVEDFKERLNEEIKLQKFALDDQDLNAAIKKGIVSPDRRPKEEYDDSSKSYTGIRGQEWIKRENSDNDSDQKTTVKPIPKPKTEHEMEMEKSAKRAESVVDRFRRDNMLDIDSNKKAQEQVVEALLGHPLNKVESSASSRNYPTTPKEISDAKKEIRKDNAPESLQKIRYGRVLIPDEKLKKG